MKDQGKQPEAQLGTGQEDLSILQSPPTSADRPKWLRLSSSTIRVTKWVVLIFSCLAALFKMITNYLELWKGNRTIATWAIGVLCLVLLTGVLLWLAFGRKPVSGDSDDKKAEPEAKVSSWRFPRLRKVALLLLGLVVVGTLFAGSSLYTERAARRGKAVALVAGFDGPDRQNYKVGEHLALSLSKSLGPYSAGIVRSLSDVVTRELGSPAARALGERYNADMVLWGWYEVKGQEVQLTVHVEMMTKGGPSPVLPAERLSLKGTVKRLANFEIQQRLSDQMTLLATLAEGFIAFDRGEYQLAVMYLTVALGQDDWGGMPAGKRDAFFCRGTSYILIGEMGRAVTDLSRAVEIDPTYELALYNLGYAFDMLAGKETDASARRSRYADALKYYEKAIDQDPQDKEAYNNHGCVLIELDDDARNLLQAVEDLSTAIAVDPRYDLAYYNRARARIQGGETAAAIADLTQAIEINPKFAQAYSERGLIHLNSERPLVAESIEDFTLAIKANPTLAVAYYNRGIAYREIKRLDLAVADLRVSLALGEADAEAELRKMGVDPKATR